MHRRRQDLTQLIILVCMCFQMGFYFKLINCQNSFCVHASTFWPAKIYSILCQHLALCVSVLYPTLAVVVFSDIDLHICTCPGVFNCNQITVCTFYADTSTCICVHIIAPLDCLYHCSGCLIRYACTIALTFWIGTTICTPT